MVKVIKRNGETQEYENKKIQKVLEWACKDLKNVSPFDIAMKFNDIIYDGIKTTKIHEGLIKSAYELIDIKHTDYEYVAGRLLSMLTRKQIFNVFLDKDLPSLREVFKTNTELGFYDPKLLDKFDDKTIEKFEKLIDHSNDNKLPYSAYRKLIDSYVAKDRSNEKGYIYETPQYVFMFVSIFFGDTYEEVKKNYEMLVDKLPSYPTPLISGARTSTPQYASCAVVEVGDSTKSLMSSLEACAELGSKKFGLGLGFSSLRSEGDSIRNGEVKHTGIIPFLRMFQSTVDAFSQGGLRKGSATAYVNIWNPEIERIVPLKNGLGTEATRVKNLDYCFNISGYFLKRMLKGEDISLFSTKYAPKLNDLYGYEEFNKVYEEYEADLSVPRTKINGKKLLIQMNTEGIGTGRLYWMFIDNVNKQNRFKEKIRQGNLCCEIVLPTEPIKYHGDESAEIALCNLSAVNLAVVKDGDYTKLRDICHLLVRNVDKTIDEQTYYVKATEKQKLRRSLGIGVTNFAYWLAEMKLDYFSKESYIEIDKLFEHFQYYLLEASMLLAKEKGKCEWFDKTRYAEGFLPIDEANNKHVRKLLGDVDREWMCDWEKLRKDIKKHGLRNSVLSAQMPVESSSLVTSTTNGVQPPRDLIVIKKNKVSGNIKVVAPKAYELASDYTLTWDFENNEGILNVYAIMQQWIDQAISCDRYYDKNYYDNKLIPMEVMFRDLIQFYNQGGKCLYYTNIRDVADENIDDCESCKI